MSSDANYYEIEEMPRLISKVLMQDKSERTVASCLFSSYSLKNMAGPAMMKFKERKHQDCSAYCPTQNISNNAI